MQTNFSERDQMESEILISMISELDKISPFDEEIEKVKLIRNIILDNILLLVNDRTKIIKRNLEEDFINDLS